MQKLSEDFNKFINDAGVANDLHESKEIMEKFTEIAKQIKLVSSDGAHKAELFLHALEQIAQSVKSLASQEKFLLLSVATLGSGLALVSAAVILIKLGFHMHHSLSHETEGLHDSLNEIDRRLQAGIENIERLITQKVIKKLDKITDQLTHLTNIMATGFKESGLDKLKSIINHLGYHINGTTPLKQERIDHYINKLMHWIKDTSKTQTQTHFFNSNADTQEIISILGNESFKLKEQFSTFIILLNKLVPNLLSNEKQPNIIVLHLPIKTLILTIEFECLKKNIPNKDYYTSRLTEASTALSKVHEVIKQICNEPQFLNVLLAQYNDYRFQIGRALCECFNLVKENKNVSESSSLQFILTQCKEEYSDKFNELLDEMEYRRLMIEFTLQITGQSLPTLSLESKETLLKQQKAIYNYKAKNLNAAILEGDYTAFEIAHLNGADFLQWQNSLDVIQFVKKVPYKLQNKHFSGQAIHYLQKRFILQNGFNFFTNTDFMILHQLLKFKEIKWKNKLQSAKLLDSLFYQENFIDSVLSTEVSLYEDIKHLRGQVFVKNIWFALILYCASGEEINYNKSLRLPNEKLAQPLIEDMNSENGLLNKKSLRTAYTFYNEVEAGKNPSTDHIDHHCIVWLAVILNNPAILSKFTHLKLDLHKKIRNSHIDTLLLLQLNVKDPFISQSQGVELDPEDSQMSLIEKKICLQNYGRLDPENSQPWFKEKNVYLQYYGQSKKIDAFLEDLETLEALEELEALEFSKGLKSLEALEELEALKHYLKDSKDVKTLKYLERYKDPGYLKHLKNCLLFIKHKNHFKRLDSLEYLKHLKLIECLKDPKKILDLKQIQYLESLKNPEKRNQVLHLLNLERLKNPRTLKKLCPPTKPSIFEAFNIWPFSKDKFREYGRLKEIFFKEQQKQSLENFVSLEEISLSRQLYRIAIESICIKNFEKVKKSEPTSHVFIIKVMEFSEQNGYKERLEIYLNRQLEIYLKSPELSEIFKRFECEETYKASEIIKIISPSKPIEESKNVQATPSSFTQDGDYLINRLQQLSYETRNTTRSFMNFIQSKLFKSAQIPPTSNPSRSNLFGGNNLNSSLQISAKEAERKLGHEKVKAMILLDSQGQKIPSNKLSTAVVNCATVIPSNEKKYSN